MSLPREWSLHHNPQQDFLHDEPRSSTTFIDDAGTEAQIVAATSQDDEFVVVVNGFASADENSKQSIDNQLLGSLFSIHSAPVYDRNRGNNDSAVDDDDNSAGVCGRPVSLVVQTSSAAITASTPVVVQSVVAARNNFSPPETIDDEDNDNLLTISSLTARPLIAKSRELGYKKAKRARIKEAAKRKRRNKRRRKAAHLEPLDGGYGWVVVFGAFFVQFWVAGLVKSYGVLYVEVLEVYRNSSATLASWIPAILSCLCLALAPVTSMLSQKYSCRKVVFVGGLFCSLGLIVSYFSTSLIHLLFTFGVLTGIGGGLSTTPGIILVSQYFDKHRALANGICVSGTAAGGFVFPLLIEYLVGKFEFHGTLLILGGCMLHVCASACLYRPLESNYPEEDVDETEVVAAAQEQNPTADAVDVGSKRHKLEMLFDSNNDQTVKNNILNELFHQNGNANAQATDNNEEAKDIVGNTIVMKPISKIRSSSMLHSVEDLSTDSTCFYKSRCSQRSLRASNLAICRDSYADSLAQQHLQKQLQFQHPKGSTVEQSASKESLPQRLSRYIDLSLLKESRFIAMCLSVALMSTGSPYMLYYLPAYVLSMGYSKTEAGYLVAISAAFDLCGRLGLGWLSDLQLFDRRKVYITSIVGAGLSVLLIPLGHSLYILVGSVAVYGLCLGCWFLLIPVLLADQFGTDKISSSYGLVRMFQSIGAITVPPFAGFMRDVTGSYIICFLFMGTCMVLGGVPLLLVSNDMAETKNDTELGVNVEAVESLPAKSTKE